LDGFFKEAIKCVERESPDAEEKDDRDTFSMSQI
jgi:hypothetical protein